MKISDEVSGNDLEKPGVYVYTKDFIKRTADFNCEKFFQVKVGEATRQSIRDRIKAQVKSKTSTSGFDEILILRAYPCDNAKVFEGKIHSILKAAGFHKRTQESGIEWFLASPELIDTIAEAIGLIVTESLINETSQIKPLTRLEAKNTIGKDRKTSAQIKETNFTQFVSPFTIKDNKGRTIVSDLFMGDSSGAYVNWVIELSKDPKTAQELIRDLSSAWRVQSENSVHRNAAPRQYVSGYNGVYVHFHNKGYPTSALKDFIRISDYFKLDAHVTDATGVDLLSKLDFNRPREVKKVNKNAAPEVIFKITDSLNNTFEEKSLCCADGAYVKWLKKLCEDPEIKTKLIRLAHNSKANLLVENDTDPSPEGRKLYCRISESLWACTALSKNNGLDNLQEISDYLNLDAKCELLESN